LSAFEQNFQKFEKLLTFKGNTLNYKATNTQQNT
jgi:hypothetical protein